MPELTPENLRSLAFDADKLSSAAQQQTIVAEIERLIAEGVPRDLAIKSVLGESPFEAKNN